MRQGDLISVELAGFTDTFPDIPYLLVITHSCDISSQYEPYLEILPCHQIPEKEGNKTKGKNSRELHFSAMDGAWFSVRASEKVSLDKAGIRDAAICGSLVPQEQMLQNWLASRYRRQALDDSINNLFSQLKLRDIVAKFSDCLCGIWLSSEEIGNTKSVGDYQDFDIKVFFVFDTSDASCEANLAAFEEKIQKRVECKHINPANVSTYCIRDDAFTYREVMDLTFVNFDYLSNDET